MPVMHAMLPLAMLVVSLVKKSLHGDVCSLILMSGFCFCANSICASSASTSDSLPAHMSTTMVSPSAEPPDPPLLAQPVIATATPATAATAPTRNFFIECLLRTERLFRDSN